MARTKVAEKPPAAPGRRRPASPGARETLDRLGLLPEEDVAAMRGVSLESMRNDRAAGAGPPYVKWGLRVFYRVSALQGWLAAQEQSGTRDRSRGAERSA